MVRPVPLEMLETKLRDRQQSLHDKVLTAVYTVQFYGGGGPVSLDEIMTLLEVAGHVVERTDVTAIMERLQTEGLADTQAQEGGP